MFGRIKNYVIATRPAYAYVFGMIIAGIMSVWGLIIFLSLPSAISLLKTFKTKILNMADALTAQFDTIFGILLILAIFLESKLDVPLGLKSSCILLYLK